MEISLKNKFLNTKIDTDRGVYNKQKNMVSLLKKEKKKNFMVILRLMFWLKVVLFRKLLNTFQLKNLKMFPK